MNKRHKTADGIIMFISEMEDTHLLNYVLTALKAINKIKVELRRDAKPSDKFTAAMYTFEREYDDDELSEMLDKVCNNLYPYLAEILLRGIDLSVRGINVLDEIQKTFERKSKMDNQINIEQTNEFNLITQNIDDEF